jgi:hypothetical protein
MWTIHTTWVDPPGFAFEPNLAKAILIIVSLPQGGNKEGKMNGLW